MQISSQHLQDGKNTVLLEQGKGTRKSSQKEGPWKNLLGSFQVCAEQTAQKRALLVQSHLHHSVHTKVTCVPIATKADPSKQPTDLKIVSIESQYCKACQTCSIFLQLNTETGHRVSKERLPPNSY